MCGANDIMSWIQAFGEGKKNMRRRMIRVLALAAAMLGLGGCGAAEHAKKLLPRKAEAPKQTTLEADSDGTIRETVIDTLDQSWYSSQELQDMVDTSVAAYCREQGEGAVRVDRFTVQESTVTLAMTYRSAQDYAGYNNVSFFNGSMLQAQLEGYLFDHEFRLVEKGVSSEETVSSEVPLSHKEYQVLITDASHAVVVPGKAVYISANARAADAYTVVPGEEERAQEGLELPSSQVYIQEQSSRENAGDLDRTYIYVVYEF